MFINTRSLLIVMNSSLPERVSHSVSEADEVVLILGHQVSGVEVSVSFDKHVSQDLLLRQLFAAGVTEERTLTADLRQQQPRLP